jgi:bla regulator protein BlaR1
MNPLFNHLWQSTVFVLVMWLLTLLLRGSRARRRHDLWLAASIKFLIPFSLFITIGGQIHWRRTTAPIPATFTIAASTLSDVSEPFIASQPQQPTPARQPIPWPSILLLVWACGSFGVSAAWAIRWWRIRSAVRAGTPVPLDLPIRAVASPTLIEPGVFGIFRPVLMLPNGIFDHLSPGQIRAVIEHEMSHVRHRDNLIAAFQMFVETVFWFYPLVWWVGKKIVEERERACDETVLLSGNDPHTYAEAILNVCKFYVESPLVCVTGVTGAGLKQRIEAIVATRTGRELNRWQRALLATCAAVAVLLPFAIGIMNSPGLRAQPAAAGPTPKWEVVSIKPCSSDDGGGRSGKGMPTPGRLRANCAPLSRLIEESYGIFSNGRGPNWNHFVFEGIPAWANSERYTIEAKAESPQGHVMMQGPMMQTLLEERFKLKIRREPREVPVYHLTVAKGGPKNLKPTKPDSCIPFDLATMPPPTAGTEICEIIGRGVARNATVGQFDAFGIGMAKFAEGLSGLLDRNVIDKTGIEGKFDIKVDIPLEDLTPPPNEDPNSRRAVRNFRDDEIAFSAMRQLGLKLEPAKGPGIVFVVEHVERPSDNFTPPQQASVVPASPITAKPQRSPAVVAEQPLRFDAATIKPVNPSGGRGGNTGRSPRGAGHLEYTTGRVTGARVNTITLIMEAYRVKEYQVTGLTGWAESERFDFEGKAEGAANDNQLRQMLQTLLSERYGLALHRDTKEMPVLMMTIAKDGFKVQEAKPENPPFPTHQRPDDGRSLHLYANATTEKLAEILTNGPDVDFPVIDRTALTGKYLFRLGWDAEEGFLPSVAKEFGLRFDKQKVQVATLVIDRVQRPAEN